MTGNVAVQPGKGWLWALLPLAVLATSAGCDHGATHAKADGPKQPAPVAVTVVDLQRRDVERTVVIEGSLLPWEAIVVSSKRGGRVARAMHEMGDRVRPGEVLLQLDPVDAELSLRQAEAKYLGDLVRLGITRERADEFVQRYGTSESLLHNAEVDELIRNLPAYKQGEATRDKLRQQLVRQQGLFGRGVGTAQDLQNMENDFQAADAALDNVELTVRTNIASAMASRAALDVAKEELDDMSVLAPRLQPEDLPPGITNPESLVYAVRKRHVHEGKRIKADEAVYDLIIEDPLRLWANVPEPLRGRVAIGQEVRLRPMSRPGEIFKGRVSRIDPGADTVNRTFGVEMEVPNLDRKLLPGGFARGEIVVDQSSQAVVVPVESVYRFAGVTKIFLVEDGKARGYAVEIGRELNDGVEVVGLGTPLPAKGQVVTTGQNTLAKLAEGTPVVVRKPDVEPVGGPRPVEEENMSRKGAKNAKEETK